EADLARRTGLFDRLTTGWRCIHGESDGWPGLVLDRYDRTCVLKLYTAAWKPWLPELTAVIRQALEPESIVLRLSRNISPDATDPDSFADGIVIAGEPVTGPIQFLENGLTFE